MKSLFRLRPGVTSTVSQVSKRSYRSDLLGTTQWQWLEKDQDLTKDRAMEYIDKKPQTVKVAVTGASGNIGYALLFRLARFAIQKQTKTLFFF